MRSIRAIGAAAVVGFCIVDTQAAAEDDFTHLSIPMVSVSPSRFLAGDVELAKPVHGVTVTRGFAIGRFEVTNSEYAAGLNWAFEKERIRVGSDTVYLRSGGVPLIVADGNFTEIKFDRHRFVVCPARAPWAASRLDGFDPGAFPVQGVTWFGAAAFCNWMSEVAGVGPLYDDEQGFACTGGSAYGEDCFRLPTEAEWELSARGPDSWMVPWARTVLNERQGYWGVDATTLERRWTMPVGSFSPFGDSPCQAADMVGNVWEWVFDASAPYTANEEVDPAGPDVVGGDRVVRGCPYHNNWLYTCNATTRAYNPATAHSRFIGFRVARTITDVWSPSKVEVPPLPTPWPGRDHPPVGWDKGFRKRK